MRYHVLVCDYDGTLAKENKVDLKTIQALTDLKSSGRKLILVTGRQMTGFLSSLDHPELFDRIILENGGILYHPATQKEKALAEPPPANFIEELRRRGVQAIAPGKVVVATWRTEADRILQTIQDLGLELQIVFNREGLMVLPSGVNKASGLETALADMDLSAHNAVGIGDAENDHSFLALCECSCAVSNALPAIKENVDLVTQKQNGAGIQELIERLIHHDLDDLDEKLSRHHIPLGIGEDRKEIFLQPYGVNILLAGSTRSGKSAFVTGFIERLIKQKYQFCIVDPKGEHDNHQGIVVVGDSRQSPSMEEIHNILLKPDRNLAINLLGLSMEERPEFFDRLCFRLHEIRMLYGRPHWIIVDEAHHVLPNKKGNESAIAAPRESHGMLFVTVEPESLSPPLLSSIDLLIITGREPESIFCNFAKQIGKQAPAIHEKELEKGEAIGWWKKKSPESIFRFRIIPSDIEHQRHRQNYIKGELSPEESFYFRGPERKLNLRAHNLEMFLQFVEGIDDETWLHHLNNGDYEHWFRETIKDSDLAKAAEEAKKRTSVQESRRFLKTAIEKQIHE